MLLFVILWGKMLSQKSAPQAQYQYYTLFTDFDNQNEASKNSNSK